MRKATPVDRRELLRKAQVCARKMKKLAALYDRATPSRKDRSFDRMTELRNEGMGLLQKAHGRRSEPVNFRLSPKRAV